MRKGDFLEYIALYRKYRPLVFNDIYGQEHITEIIKNQINAEKFSHAYIFSGTRGTGKTSAAKIFSRAINCNHKVDGEPCNKCDSCLEILNNSSTDIVELDAASNNGVDNIRQINQEVSYSNASSKYKVYIIDEVHMLTTQAFNALLKTLEEPPKNVIFILATTEPHKIPITIHSRCIRFDFYKISIDNILKRLKYVMNEENIEYEEQALEVISKLAGGAMRDALSILDRCLSGTSTKLKLDTVNKVVGNVDNEVIDSIVLSINTKDEVNIIKNVDKAIKKGIDTRRLVLNITEKFLDMYIENPTKRISKIIGELSRLDNEIRNYISPEIFIKAAFMNISNLTEEEVYNNSDTSNLISRIEKLENKLKDINNIKKESITDDISNKYIEKITKETKELKEETNDSVFEFKELTKLITKIAMRGNPNLSSALAGSKIYIDNNIVITTSNAFASKVLNQEDIKKDLKKIFKEEYNIDKNIEIKFNEVKKTNKFDEVLKEMEEYNNG